MQVKIIIQQTESGLAVVYPRDYNQYAPENKKFQDFLRDEANISDFADAYSIQINNDLKVYSLISSDIKDFLNRAGSFFAVRVIVAKDKNIDEIQSLLNNIKDRYKEFYQNNDMNSLNFTDLTEGISESLINNSNDFKNDIVLGFNKDSYAFKNQSPLNVFFNEPSIKMAKCLYLFDEEKTQKGVFERMIPLEEVKNNYLKTKVNTSSLLDLLKVNDIEIEKPYPSQFNLWTTKQSSISYKRGGEKQIQNYIPNINGINLYPKNPESKVNPSKNRRKKNNDAVIYTLLIISVLGILRYLSWEFSKPEVIKQQNIQIGTPTSPINKTKNEIKFEFSTEKVGTDFEYSVVKPENLKKYKFKYAGKKWSFINNTTKKPFLDFNKEIVSDIFKNENINDTLQNKFILALENISKKEIPEKVSEIVKENKPVTKPKQNKKTSNSVESNKKTNSATDKINSNSNNLNFNPNKKNNNG
ncbi:hypothetical protein [Flavobacterium facile]|uniref:hypothetical protein n=1 Tax=Flavobacterium facile TaxID=2893174 RepID=UPI002E776F26|nr:hypothetical protein [Flavobacterium sp. T-12]